MRAHDTLLVALPVAFFFSVALVVLLLAARKADLQWIDEVPVQTHVSKGSNRISSHAPTAAERALIAQTDAAPIPYWVPAASFGREREMWRAGHKAMGIAEKEHAHLIALCRAGKVEEACRFLERHIEAVRKDLLQVVANAPKGRRKRER